MTLGQDLAVKSDVNSSASTNVSRTGSTTSKMILRVVLVTSAHVEITPLVEATVTFTVQ